MISDIQKLLKRMRKRYAVRYIVAGEHGSALGRAHWHGVFHFYGDVLPETWEGPHLTWTQEEWDRVGGIHIPEWAIYGDPLGHVHIKRATYAHTRYALKYLMKDEADPAKDSMLVMSKKPPLGYAYFMRLAEQTAQGGMVIENLRYQFDVLTKSGEQKRMPFLLTGTLAEMYLQRYIDTWRALRGNSRWPTSELVDNFAQWGRLGNEQALTEAAQADMPSEYVYRDGVYKLRKAGEASRTERALYPEAFGAIKQPETLAEYTRRRHEEFVAQRGRERSEARKNESTWKQGQRQRIERERREAVRVCLGRCNITEAEYAKLPQSWRKFLLSNPRDGQSLLAAGRRDWDAGNGPSVALRNNLRGWF